MNLPGSLYLSHRVFVKGVDPLLPVQGWGLGMRGTGFLKLRWGLTRLRYLKQGLRVFCALACLSVLSVILHVSPSPSLYDTHTHIHYPLAASCSPLLGVLAPKKPQLLQGALLLPPAFP